MLDPWIVKRVVPMRQHLDGGAPWAQRRIRLRIPDFAEGGGLSEILGEDGDPAPEVGIPADGTAVRPATTWAA